MCLAAGTMLAMASTQAFGLDIEEAKMSSKQSNSEIKAVMQEASKKEAERQLEEMKAEAISALNERLRFLAKQPEIAQAPAQQTR